MCFIPIFLTMKVSSIWSNPVLKGDAVDDKEESS